MSVTKTSKHIWHSISFYPPIEDYSNSILIAKKKVSDYIAAILVAIQTPASAHIAVMLEPPVEITQRRPAQWGEDAIKGDITNPHAVGGVQYLA